MKRKTIVMMTAMIISSLFNFGCSKKADITIEGGSTTTESVKTGDSIILKCDSPEHFGFWISSEDESPLSRQCTTFPIEVKKNNTVYTAIENNFIIVASITDNPEEQISLYSAFNKSPLSLLDKSSKTKDYAVKTFTDAINKNLSEWHTYDTGNLICRGKSSVGETTTYNCETTIYTSSSNSRIVIYTGADGDGFWVANLKQSNASSQVTIKLNDTVKINLTIHKTTDISKSYKSAE